MPVIVSVKVDNYFKNSPTIFPKPYVWRQISGNVEQMGHAILIVGYDDNLRAFKFANSWGQNWGNNGYGYISYDVYKYVLNEAYIIKPSLTKTPQNSEILEKVTNNVDNRDITAGLNFEVTNVIHIPPGNYPPQFLAQASITFQGKVSLPAGIGRTAQVVIYFYQNINGGKGNFIGSVDPNFSTIRGQAVTGTPPRPLPPNQKVEDTFFAYMRYYALNVPKGYPYRIITSNLIAEPVLLIDGFPIRVGKPHYFFVNL